MKFIQLSLVIGLVILAIACSKETLKRAGYETLQNVQKQQCQDELTADCSSGDSYETYQSKMKEHKESQ